jgi:hypothetical protein
MGQCPCIAWNSPISILMVDGANVRALADKTSSAEQMGDVIFRISQGG